MKFKDFIYYIMLIVVAGLFLVLAFSYFGKIKVGSGGGLDTVSVDLASGEVNSGASFYLDIPDFLSYDVLEFYFYSFYGSGFGKIVVSDYIAAGYADPSIDGSLIIYNAEELIFFNFYYNLSTFKLSGSIFGLSLELTPVKVNGYFYLKGVNYV